MYSAVLHLRGDKLTPQPVEDSDDNVLCWNGEVFGMNGSDDDDRRLMQDSDTTFLSEKLQLAGEKVTETLDVKEIDPVVEVLRAVRGPFAMAWLHAKTKRLYFAHDRFGRRSLLYRRWGSGRDVIDELAGTETTEIEVLESDLERFVLSNVAIGDNEEERAEYQELPASGIYVLSLRTRQLRFYSHIPVDQIYSLPVTTGLNDVQDRFGSKLPAITDMDSFLESSARSLLVALSDSVGVRVRSIPPRILPDGFPAARVAVLFSGGLDSVVLAALSHFHAPSNEPVDLLTVCFDETSGFASPDRLAAELAHCELCSLFPERQWNLVKVNIPRSELTSQQHEVQTLMAPCDTHMDFNIGAAFWFLSRGHGELQTSTQENATLAELNAFLNPQRADLRKLETQVAALELFAGSSSPLLCPVLKCGRKRKSGCVVGVCKSCCFKMQRAVEKLLPSESDNDQRVAQGCRAMLVSMGIQSESHVDLLLNLLKEKHQDTEGEYLCCRVHRTKQNIVKATVAPRKTEAKPPTQYHTSARVVLVGIGADEQLAGYGRHRTTLINGGEAALRSELQMDLNRIWKRNLGRDDRCIAAHGREARFPFLDENVVSTIATFPVSSLCDGDLPRGVGDKRALRLVAKSLGLQSCAGLAKRAIQFGSRIAKVSNNGSNRQTQGISRFSSVS
ncbi:Asparagine synthetase domain-containing protein 1 [Phytophthora citrophthora]|uniref:Asparagine synthetase domain-containing protein 1 n=1 Tax=Phytophthora citrophthora TaxID=4793 RepID=A0AAD9LJT6_9STRA|nr:Asparagine synthetase domain-containing protein 1 [Phytophthora citrophthora]